MPGPGLPSFVDELKSTVEFVMGSSMWEPKPVLGHPGMTEFINNYEKRYGVKPNYHASLRYAGLQILEAAVKHATSLTRRRFEMHGPLSA